MNKNKQLQVKEEVIKDLIKSSKKHISRYGFKSSNIKDICKLIEK